MNTQEIALDLSKAPMYAQMVTIGQGDSGGTTVVASVYDNGVAADLTGKTARFCMRLPRNAGYVRDTNCAVEGNEITYTFDEAHCASVAGRTDEAYFEILSGSTVVYSTSRFKVMVLRACDSGTEAARVWEPDFEAWTAAKDAQVAEMVANAAQAVYDALHQDLPLMASDTRGGAKLGDGLAIDENGALYVETLTVAEVHAITGVRQQGE